MAKSRVRPILLTAGNWTGMRYSRWSGQADPTLAYFAYNAYVDSAGPGSAYRSRPGRYRVSSTQLGGGGAGQLVYQFTKNTGTQYTVGIAGGKFYTLNWATGAWTEVLTASDFSSASITLSSTARCHAVTFNNTMVVSDGTNVPWTWDGTTNGGLTKLTNAPVFYGQPTVRAGKLFGIKNTDRAAIVWSEENAANTGYEAGGYSNYWALIQQGSDPLFAIRGTNDGLYYWRQRSIGVIRGDFGADFTTSSTFDAISNLVGTRAPRAVLYYNDTFYFPDEYGRPWAMQPGGSPTPLWEQVSLAFPQDTSDDNALFVLGWDVAVATNDMLAMETMPVSTLGGVLFCNSASNNTGDDTHGGIYFGANGRAQGFWFWQGSGLVGVGASGEVINSQTNLPEILQIEETGYTYALGKRDQWFDQGSGGSNSSTLLDIVGPRLGTTNGVELHFDRLDAVVDVRTGSTINFTAEVLTSRSPTSTALLQVSGTTSATVEEKRISYGFNRSGRWAHVRMLFSPSSGGGFPQALHGYTLTAYPVSDSPLVS